MKIDRFVNNLLRKFWPEDKKGERAVSFHSQNLNEDRNGDPKGLPYEGRCWLHTPRGEVQFSWHLWRSSLGVSLQRCGDSGGLQTHVAIPPVSLWFTFPFGKSYDNENYFDIDVHDNALWWQFGGNSFGDWDSKTPKWMHGSFHVDDFFLGKQKYTGGKAEPVKVVIPMPEGPYEATVSITEDTWSRPRWRTIRVRRADVKIPQGIPHEDKGEDSWNCGTTRSYGLSCPADSVEEAIGKTVQNVLRSRKKYDGDLMAVYPHPNDQTKPTPSGGNEGQAEAT